MASPGEQDAHTRHVGTAWRHQSDGISRRGEGVPDGTAGEAAAFDLRHQTLALARNRLRVRRSPAGAQQPPWRSGARRPDSSAGREPKGAIALPCFRVMAITELQRRKITSRTPVMIAGKERSTATGKGRSAGGAFALPVSPKGKHFFAVAPMICTGARISDQIGSSLSPPFSCS